MSRYGQMNELVSMTAGTTDESRAADPPVAGQSHPAPQRRRRMACGNAAACRSRPVGRDDRRPVGLIGRTTSGGRP